MPQQISKKILIYFFLFIVFGSLNNKNLVNFQFPNIENIDIQGLAIENKEFQKSQISPMIAIAYTSWSA